MRLKLVCKCGGDFEVVSYFCPGGDRQLQCRKCNFTFITNCKEVFSGKLPGNVIRQIVPDVIIKSEN